MRIQPVYNASSTGASLLSLFLLVVRSLSGALVAALLAPIPGLSLPPSSLLLASPCASSFSLVSSVLPSFSLCTYTYLCLCQLLFDRVLPMPVFVSPMSLSLSLFDSKPVQQKLYTTILFYGCATTSNSSSSSSSSSKIKG